VVSICISWRKQIVRFLVKSDEKVPDGNMKFVQ